MCEIHLYSVGYCVGSLVCIENIVDTFFVQIHDSLIIYSLKMFVVLHGDRVIGVGNHFYNNEDVECEVCTCQDIKVSRHRTGRRKYLLQT